MATKQEIFLEQMGRNYVAAIKISSKKNADYATATDPFQNFRESALFAGTTVEQGIMTRLGDKFTRIKNLLNRTEGPAVADESIEDTLLDAMNYVNIILTFIQIEGAADPEMVELTPELPEPEKKTLANTLKALFGQK